MADAVIRRYKTRDPEEIISRRAIKLKDIRFCHDLLGYYTVILNCEYIGINSNCTNAQRVSAMAHELGHALFDRKHASSGQAFQDTYFYSLNNSKTERRANTFAAELLLADDDVLEPIGYYEFNADRKQLEANLPSRYSSAYRAMKYQELLQEFQYAHSGLITLDEIARIHSSYTSEPSFQIFLFLLGLLAGLGGLRCYRIILRVMLVNQIQQIFDRWVIFR